MLRKFAYNKIFRTTGMLVLLLLLLLFPSSKEYSLEEDITRKSSLNVKKNEFFLIDSKNYVARCKIDLSYNDVNDFVSKVLELLIIDGKYQDKIPNGFKAILPADTKINKIDIKESIITIDFSKEFLELDKKVSQKAIEAIIYNLTLHDGIGKIYIKVDDVLLSYIPNTNKILNQPLDKSYGINKITNVTDYKNINSVTVYFVSKNNLDYYYIPVTKVTNDNRDKIKIIVDELTSSHIYETNLMSFLNYNTKLIDYSLKNDTLSLNFNDYLFDDVSSKNILEEVIYSISLSVRDNYDVNNVIFLVNGKEITKSVLKNIE